MSGDTLTIRKYTPGEESALWNLYHDTIHRVNCQDYTAEQVAAWAPHEIDHQRWRTKIQSINPFVCQSGETIVGYADLQTDGLIDHFFVHHAWQGKGVAKLLFQTIESEAAAANLAKLHAHVSITARPFFQSRGFQLVQQQEVVIGEVALTNFLMEKELSTER